MPARAKPTRPKLADAAASAWRWLWHGNSAPNPNRSPLGRAAEDAAARLLKRQGFRVLARNVVLRQGEADLVCEAPDRETIVIVEVKARRLDAPGGMNIPPEAAVTARKRRVLRSIARSLVHVNRWHGRPVRIDVIAADCRGEPDTHAAFTLRHFPNAVGED